MRGSRLRRCTSGAFAIALAVASLASIAAARPAPHAAELSSYRDAVADGTIAFREARFPEARAAFARAYGIHPDPVLLFNIASCWRREGKNVEAIAAYLRFLDHAPSGDPRRRLATETVSALEAELAAARRLPEPEAEAEPAQAPAAPKPAPPAPAPPPPVEPEPRIMIDDRLVAPEPEVAGDAVPLPEAPPSRRGSALRPLGIGLSTVGVIVLAAGAVDAMRARAIEDDLEALQGRTWGHAEAEQYRKGERAAQRALIFGAAGAVLVGGGVTLFVVGRSRERPMRLGAAPTSGGAAVSLSGRF